MRIKVKCQTNLKGNIMNRGEISTCIKEIIRIDFNKNK